MCSRMLINLNTSKLPMPSGVYLFKINYRNTRCVKFVQNSQQRQNNDVFEQISFISFFHCWLWNVLLLIFFKLLWILLEVTPCFRFFKRSVTIFKKLPEIPLHLSLQVTPSYYILSKALEKSRTFLTSELSS